MNELVGKRVLVTRPRSQASDLVDKLEALGAVPILFPVIEIQPAADSAAIDSAIASLHTYTWVIFTSVNGVAAFCDRLQQLRPEEAVFQGLKVAAIGPKTAAALQTRGIHVDYVPGEYRAEAILNGLGDVKGQKVLLARTDLARKNLLTELIRAGALAESIDVYRVLPAQIEPQAWTELEKGIDIATFTSSSTVHNFVALAGAQTGELLVNAVIACIGPITADAAREEGLAVTVVAREYTIEGLLLAVVEYLQSKQQEMRTGI